MGQHCSSCTVKRASWYTGECSRVLTSWRWRAGGLIDPEQVEDVHAAAKPPSKVKQVVSKVLHHKAKGPYDASKPSASWKFMYLLPCQHAWNKTWKVAVRPAYGVGAHMHASA